MKAVCVHETVTHAIIAALERGVVPWVKHWTSGRVHRRSRLPRRLMEHVNCPRSSCLCGITGTQIPRRTRTGRLGTAGGITDFLSSLAR